MNELRNILNTKVKQKALYKRHNWIKDENRKYLRGVYQRYGKPHKKNETETQKQWKAILAD
jgi:hypothetical protein